MKITEDNHLSLVIEYLEDLKEIYGSNVGIAQANNNNKERIKEIEKLIKYLQKTN